MDSYLNMSDCKVENLSIQQIFTKHLRMEFLPETMGLCYKVLEFTEEFNCMKLELESRPRRVPTASMVPRAHVAKSHKQSRCF